ncbi:MAG: hypothetical protein ACXVB9_13935 [Bdellovibrionota bacterium]
MRYDPKKMEFAQECGAALLFMHGNRIFAAIDTPTPATVKARIEHSSGVLVECISFAEGRRILDDSKADFVLVAPEFLRNR